jgi:hypothetical protein
VQRSIGAYDIEAELGRGGMGRVLRARHRPTGAIRALKVLDRVDDGLELLDRFRREAETIARAGGEGVVAVHETGVEDGHLYLVMDLMSGGSLKAKIARGPLPWREALSLIVPIARALERCHAAGIVHRDVKPDNILLDDRGCAHLADFGLAKDLTAESLTMTGTVLGTPHYMAPEALNGKRADERADVFSLAATLYELVTGTRPHDGGSPFDLLRAIHKADRRPVRELAPGAPEELEGILSRALAADRMKRTAGAAELATELEDLLAGRSPRARARGPVVGVVVLALSVLGLLVLVAVRAVLLARAPVTPGVASLEESLAAVAHGQPGSPGWTSALERVKAATSGAGAEAAIAALGSAIDASGSVELRRLRAELRMARRAKVLAADLAAIARDAPKMGHDLAVDAIANGVEGPDAAGTLVSIARERKGDVPLGLLAAVTLLRAESVRPEDRAAAEEVLAALPKDSEGPEQRLLVALRDVAVIASAIANDIEGNPPEPRWEMVGASDVGHACNALAGDPVLAPTRTAVLGPLVPLARKLMGLLRAGGGFGDPDPRARHGDKVEKSWARLSMIATPEGRPLDLHVAHLLFGFPPLSEGDLTTRARNMEMYDRVGRELRGKDDLLAAMLLARSAEISINLRRAASRLAWSSERTLENAVLAEAAARVAHASTAPGTLEWRWSYVEAHVSLGLAATACGSTSRKGDDEIGYLVAQIALARDALGGARDGNTEEAADVRHLVKFLLHRRLWSEVGRLDPEPPPYALPEVLCFRACLSARAGDVAGARALLEQAERANKGRGEAVKKDWDEVWKGASELVENAR